MLVKYHSASDQFFKKVVSFIKIILLLWLLRLNMWTLCGWLVQTSPQHPSTTGNHSAQEQFLSTSFSYVKRKVRQLREQQSCPAFFREKQNDGNADQLGTTPNN